MGFWTASVERQATPQEAWCGCETSETLLPAWPGRTVPTKLTTQWLIPNVIPNSHSHGSEPASLSPLGVAYEALMAYRKCMRCVFERLACFRQGEMSTARLAQSWTDLPTVFPSLGAVQCTIWAGPSVKKRRADHRMIACGAANRA
jgi:hypothetical protein